MSAMRALGVLAGLAAPLAPCGAAGAEDLGTPLLIR
jgi:hypothetical protein